MSKILTYLILFTLAGMFTHRASAQPLAAPPPIGLFTNERVTVPTDQLPWRAIGQLVTVHKRKCTGTLIAPDVVLTAGHCFVDHRGRLDPAYLFTLSVEHNAKPQQVYADHVYVERSLFANLIRRPDGLVIPAHIAPRDFAFVRLKEPIGLTVGYLPIFEGSLSALANLLEEYRFTVTQAGYPSDRNNTLYAHKDCRAKKVQPDGRLAHRCHTLSGDSGSPIFVNIGGQDTIIAVQSSAPDAKDREQADNMAITTSRLRKKLQHFLKYPPYLSPLTHPNDGTRR